MAEQPIQIEVTFDGASEATRELGRVSQGISNVGQTADRAGVTVESFSRGFQNTAQRIQGVAGAVQSLASALGSEDRTGSLIASVAGTTAQFAAMGSMLGPTGTVIGGITGLAVGLIGAARAADDTGDSMGEMGTRIATAEERVRDLNSALAELATRSRIDMGVASMAEYNTEIAGAEERLEALNQAFERMDPSLAGSTSERALTAEIRRVRGRLEELRGLRESASEEESAVMMESLAESANAGNPPVRSSGGGRRRERERDVFEMLGGAASNEDIAGISAEFERLAAERAEREAEANALIEEKRNAHYEALKEMAIEAQDAELERQREVNEALAEMENERQERIREGQLAMKENQEADEERSLERRRSLNGELMGLLGDATMAFGKSLAAIATGEQTAEEAFQGLAKAFLEMISQYATLKAATEFADAAASFAKYDYAGGAAHIGAGVAFTAIAVATGVGAAALGSAPSAPARPEAGGGTEAAQGGDVVINWNSPVITAGTQAELGRELQAAVSAAGSI